MSVNSLPGRNAFPTFREFTYYGSLIFSYNNEQFDRARIAKDFDAAEAFFNDYIARYNAYWQKNGYPKLNRQLLFITDSYETNCKIYFRITAYLKPLLVSKKRKKSGLVTAAYVADPNEEPVTDNTRPQAQNMIMSTGGGATPREPKGPPVTSEAITSAPEEQNYNSES